MTLVKYVSQGTNKRFYQSLDPVLQDSKLSAYIGAIEILVVCLLAAYWFTIWPVDGRLITITQHWPSKTLELLDTVGSLFTIIFWCSRPTYKMEWTVALSWIILLFLVFLKGDRHAETTQHVILGTFAVPCILALLFRIFGFITTTESTLYECRLKWLVISMALLILPIYPALMLSKLIHIKTFDLFALHFDVLLSSTLIPNLRTLINTIPGAPTVLFFAYGLTPLGLLAIAIRQLQGRPRHVASALLVWVFSGPIVIMAYNFFPITGPGYVFNNINNAFLHASLYPLDMATPQYGARNGMPSMHVGWMIAATILWCQSGSRIYSRFIMIIQTGLVILATLYFGEHYIIDLIVATPFMLSLIALCTTSISIRYAPRKYAICAGFLTWLLWVILLRTQLELFMANPWTAICLVVLTVFISGWQAILLSKFKTAPTMPFRTLWYCRDRVKSHQQLPEGNVPPAPASLA